MVEGFLVSTFFLDKRHDPNARKIVSIKISGTAASCIACTMPGFGELMRQESLKYVPTAILSRQTAGIRGKSLIINLPGKPKAIRQCLDAVFPAVPYCIDLLEGPFLICNQEVVKEFSPKS